MRSWDDYKKTMVLVDTIWLAAKEDDIARVTQFLEQGVDIEGKDARGYSPLMLAAYNGSLEMVHFLLEKGANPNSTDGAGNSVLMGSAFKGHLEILQALLTAGASIAQKNHSDMDAHDFATTFGRKEVAALLLKEGAGSRKSRRILNFSKMVMQRFTRAVFP